MSILLVEQNMRLALALADHVTILSAGLSAGRCVFSSAADEVRSRPDQIETYLGVAARKPG